MQQETTDSAKELPSPWEETQTQSVYDRFEMAWRSAHSVDSRPRIADYLRLLPEYERPAGLPILLRLELKCLKAAGERPSPEKYTRLFPEAAPSVLAAFREMGFADDGPPTQSVVEQSESLTGSHHQVIEVTPSFPGGNPVFLGNGSDERQDTKTWKKAGRRPSTAASLLPAVPGYEVIEELGQGGMGVVYKARHVKLDRYVALKMILPNRERSPDPLKLELFVAEARAVAQLQHPNLVQIHEIGDYDGQPYFSLELLDGGSLGQRLAGTPRPAAEAAALLEILALAVDYAHQRGVVHRDLKPANILLGADGTPKIADFGLAKRRDQEARPTDEGHIMGTPSYMAPEQAWGTNSEVGPRADIYSLGAILYEILTGRPPFKGSDKWQTIELVRSQELVPPRTLVPQIPRDLELICVKCLRKDASQRFSSARELAEELRRFQEGRPIQTRPASWAEQAWKWSRRQPAAATLIAVSALAIASLFLYLDQRVRVARRALGEQERISALRDQVQGLHLKAQEAADNDHLQDATASLTAALEIILTEAVLADMKPPLAALQTAVSSKEEGRKAKERAEAGYARLLARRDDALFHGTVFEGVDLAANVAATKRACREALALFGVSAVPTRGPAFSEHLSAEQKRRCNVAFYELLLVWAEAAAQPTAGRRAADRSQFEEALSLLDRAALLDVPKTKAFHLRRAGYLEALGDAEAGLCERGLAALARSQGALDHFLIGASHQKRGQVEEAAKEFADALREEPDHFWAGYFLGVCNLQLLRPAQARDNFTACLVSKKDFLWLYLFRGVANGQLNDFSAADEDYGRALASNPDPQARYGILVNQGELALRQARQADAWVPMPWPAPLMPDLVPVCLHAARVHANERLTAGAALLEQAVELQPDQYPAYRYLAAIRQQQKRFDEAARRYGEAIRAAKDQEPRILAQLYGERARLHRRQNKPDAALEDLALGLKAFPRWADHFARGRILHQRREYRDALAAYEDALRLRPGEAAVLRAKSDALRSLERYAESAAALDQYLENRGRPTAEVYRTRGRLRARLERPAAAIADYTQSLDMERHSATYAARGWLFLTTEAQPLALRDFDEAIRLDPDNGEAHAGRGLIRVRMGQPAEARADAEAALRPGRRTFLLLWNTAHVHSQLAKYLEGRPQERNLPPGLTRGRCQEQAVKLLREALESLRAEEQKPYWREYIRKDVYLDPIRGTPGFERLQREYGR